ncbi:MAG TPA: Uma2 family endonuclease [Spirillospora sp.]|nr:Uma2 family endonuclease [Spirillospora sp.]
MVVQQRVYTADEFWELVEETGSDERLELMDGVIFELPPSSPENTITAGRILGFLFSFVEDGNLGYVSGADGGYTLSSGTVLMPDVAFISRARVPHIPREFKGAPDLAVEVISPSETPRKVNDKTALYLANGARIVWNVYPADRIIEVWQATEDGGMKVHTLTVHEVLDGGDVLPGFRLPVSRIFTD